MSDTQRIVFVGCGSISNAWLKPMQQMPELQVVGLVDIRREAAEQQAKQYGLEQVPIGTDLASMLEQTHPDAVFDCTIPAAHVEVTLTALAHGCHVFGEKPMADTMANAHRMVQAAQKAGRIYAVIQNARYGAGIRRLRQYLQSGAIGRVTTVHHDSFGDPHFGGFRERMEHPLILDMAIHPFDQARFITGGDAQAALCKEWNPAGSWYDHAASAVVCFEMTGDIVFSYRASWCAKGLGGSSWRVIGENGTVIWDGGDSLRCQIEDKVGAPKVDVEVPAYDVGSKVGGHAGLLHDFNLAMQTGEPPETTCTDNIKSLAMVHAAIAAAERGQWVKVV
jgi:predicted dehydrogenase